MKVQVVEGRTREPRVRVTLTLAETEALQGYLSGASLVLGGLAQFAGIKPTAGAVLAGELARKLRGALEESDRPL